jgi:hypothetical protein
MNTTPVESLPIPEVGQQPVAAEVGRSAVAMVSVYEMWNVTSTDQPFMNADAILSDAAYMYGGDARTIAAAVFFEAHNGADQIIDAIEASAHERGVYGPMVPPTMLHSAVATRLGFGSSEAMAAQAAFMFEQDQQRKLREATVDEKDDDEEDEEGLPKAA